MLCFLLEGFMRNLPYAGSRPRVSRRFQSRGIDLAMLSL